MEKGWTKERRNEWMNGRKQVRTCGDTHYTAAASPLCLAQQREGPSRGGVQQQPSHRACLPAHPSLPPPSPSPQNPATLPFPPQSSSPPRLSPHSSFPTITMLRTLASRIASPSKATFRAFHQNAPLKDQMSRMCSPPTPAFVFNSGQKVIAMGQSR